MALMSVWQQYRTLARAVAWLVTLVALSVVLAPYWRFWACYEHAAYQQPFLGACGPSFLSLLKHLFAGSLIATLAWICFRALSIWLEVRHSAELGLPSGGQLAGAFVAIPRWLAQNWFRLAILVFLVVVAAAVRQLVSDARAREKRDYLARSRADCYNTYLRERAHDSTALSPDYDPATDRCAVLYKNNEPCRDALACLQRHDTIRRAF